MTKHRRITGLVAVALLAAVASAASYSHRVDRAVASANMMSIGELTAAAGKLATDEFDDQSVIFSAKR
jgi:hypothetical protein